MRKAIICDHCSQEITYKEDLVTSSYFIFVLPYHAGCYAQGLKGLKTFFLSNHPINGVSGNLTAFSSFIAVLLLLFMVPGMVKILAIFPAIPVIARLLAYVLYERHLPG